jgi:urocanate hydratase
MADELGQVINGGFGMVLDGSKSSRRLQSMLFWDVNNGISRNWARNEGALFTEQWKQNL